MQSPEPEPESKAASRWRFQSSRAVGLVELTIMLAGAGVVLLMAAPGVRRLHQDWSLRGGAYVVESALQWARLRSVSANASILFSVNAEGTAVWWTDPESGAVYETSMRWLPQGVRIVEQPGRPVRFFSRGNAAPAGSYVLRGSSGSYRVVVSPAGRIRVERM